MFMSTDHAIPFSVQCARTHQIPPKQSKQTLLYDPVPIDHDLIMPLQILELCFGGTVISAPRVVGGRQ
jgi:hypothetical protein